MFLVHVFCSDPGCAEEAEVLVEDLDELYGSVCECGYGTVMISVAELDMGAEVVELRSNRGPRRLAA